jgi:hypothetical protein
MRKKLPPVSTVALLFMDKPPMKLDTPTKPSRPTNDNIEVDPFSVKPCKATVPFKGKYT